MGLMSDAPTQPSTPPTPKLKRHNSAGKLLQMSVLHARESTQLLSARTRSNTAAAAAAPLC
jgi:hypothetical protein